MAKLSQVDVHERAHKLNGWTLERDAIHKEFTFGDFPEAVAFVNRLVPGAQAADHHPDITISYKRVKLTYTTHDEGGLTAKDFAGAEMADRVATEEHVSRP